MEVVFVPEVHVQTKEVVMRDTVITVRIPDGYAERVTTDTVSDLYTPFAHSRAEVSGGILSHSLGTHGELPTSVRIEEKIITMVDSIPYPVEVEVIREVAKPLRWRHKALMWIGVAAIVVASVGVYRKIKRPFS
jgi:hypothetical protein